MENGRTRFQQYIDGLSDTKFKRLIGIKKHTAQKFVVHLNAAYAAKHKKRGRHSKCEDNIVAPMIYDGTTDSLLFEHWFGNGA